MLRLDRAGRFSLAPNQRFGRLRRRIHGASAQNHRRNFGPVKAGKPDQIHGVRPPPLPDKNVEQLPAIAADDCLNLAMQSAVGPAGNLCAVLTLRAYEKIRFAHAIGIQFRREKLKP